MTHETKPDLDKLESQNKVISNIKKLIISKNLEPGDKLLSERVLAKNFNVPRALIRESINKLEFYGILKSKPQSGNFIGDIGGLALESMFEAVLTSKYHDLKSLIEARILIEMEASFLAATRRTKEDLNRLKIALVEYSEKVGNSTNSTQEDLLFHFAIAKASGNMSLNYFMVLIMPKIIENNPKSEDFNTEASKKKITQYEAIYQAIKRQNPELAKQKMREYLLDSYKTLQ